MLRIKIVELFAGIGAVRRALNDLTGVRSQTLFVSEINSRKREVYQVLFPESKVSKTKMLGDISVGLWFHFIKYGTVVHNKQNLDKKSLQQKENIIA